MAKPSPHAVVGEPALADVAWKGGFWGARIEQCRAVMIPTMWKVLNDPNLSHAFANFRIAAGLEEGKHSGPPFFDGDLYKWLESVASVYAVTRDENLDRLMDEIIAVIAAAQQADGYIHTPVIIARKVGEGLKTQLDDRLHFEVYNLGHLMTTACRHKAATGKDTLLSVARKAADFLCAQFRNPTPESAKNNICPAHYMGLVELYRTTGEKKYLDLAAALIDIRDLMKDGTDDNQDRIPFRAQRRAVGHAVRANYLFAGAADVYAENGDATLLEPLESLWDNVVHTKMYITGATGALYDGVSPDGGVDHNAIQRVHQAYGREYQLPNTTAYNETCANIGNALWNWRMFKLKGEARFMDVVETVLYNSLLSGISLDGTKFFYQNTLRQERALPFSLRWPRSRSKYLSSFCCPPNVLRTIAGAGSMAYGITAEGVMVNLYGSNVFRSSLADGAAIGLTQVSDYPRGGGVALTVDKAPERAMTIALRIPAWAAGATASVNGQACDEPVVAGSYLAIRRQWRTGDLVKLDLPMNPRLVLAHRLVEESRNQVAVRLGPVVYCLETSDLPAGVRLEEVLIPSDIVLKPGEGSGVLAGMTVLSGTALRLSMPSDEKALYSDLTAWKLEDLPVTFVPYFAWDNRGQSEMSIWLPVKWV